MGGSGRVNKKKGGGEPRALGKYNSLGERPLRERGTALNRKKARIQKRRKSSKFSGLFELMKTTGIKGIKTGKTERDSMEAKKKQ